MSDDALSEELIRQEERKRLKEELKSLYKIIDRWMSLIYYIAIVLFMSVIIICNVASFLIFVTIAVVILAIVYFIGYIKMSNKYYDLLARI